MENAQQTTIAGILKVELRSRVLRRLYYDRSRRHLALEMRTGGLRIYGDVPPSIPEEIISHAAPGVFYDEHLRIVLGTPISRFSATGIAFRLRLRRMRLAEEGAAL
jgi:hypothetical protein